LAALEADQFDKLPSHAQVRGFIRGYGDFLKLNTDQLIQNLDGLSEGEANIPVPLPVMGNISPELTSSDAIFKELGLKLRSQRELMAFHWMTLNVIRIYACIMFVPWKREISPTCHHLSRVGEC